MDTGIKVKHDEEKATIEFGWLWKALFTAGFLAAAASAYDAVFSYPALAEDVRTNEAEIGLLKKSVHINADNQVKIGEMVRNNQADAEWANDKLDRLLELQGVTERIPRPKVAPSTLEKLPK